MILRIRKIFLLYFFPPFLKILEDSPCSVPPRGDTARESPFLFLPVTFSTRICFSPAPRSSPGSAEGPVQAGLGSPLSVPSPLLKLGVPKLTTAQTEVETAVQKILLSSLQVCCPLQIALGNVYG